MATYKKEAPMKKTAKKTTKKAASKMHKMPDGKMMANTKTPKDKC